MITLNERIRKILRFNREESGFCEDQFAIYETVFPNGCGLRLEAMNGDNAFDVHLIIEARPSLTVRAYATPYFDKGAGLRLEPNDLNGALELFDQAARLSPCQVITEEDYDNLAST